MRPPVCTNINYFHFATEVAGLVGHDRLRRIVFGQRGDLLGQLARRVDRAVGRSGVFYKACRAVERDREATLR